MASSLFPHTKIKNTKCFFLSCCFFLSSHKSRLWKISFYLLTLLFYHFYQIYASQAVALDMTERRLGLGWKSNLLFCWCDDGLISAAKARFTISPSTVEIRMREFVMADRLAWSRCEEGWADRVWPLFPLCRLHRKEPGWFVGEHIQVLRAGLTAGMFRLGEIGRWLYGNEKLTDWDGWLWDEKLTRVGEADLVRNDCWEEGAKAEEREDDVAANADPPPPFFDRLEWLVTGWTGPLERLEFVLIIL